MKLFLRVFFAAVMVILLNFPAFAGGKALEGFELYRKPQKAPALFFQDDKGRQLTLNDFRGRLVLLNIWATWCPPCRAEMPGLNALQKSFPKEKFSVIAIATDTQGSARVAPFFQQYGLDALSMYLDPAMKTMDALHIEGIPSSYLIAPDGTMIGTLQGAANWGGKDAKQLIEDALKATDGPPRLYQPA